MRSSPVARAAAAPLVFACLRAGSPPPLDWVAAAIDAGAVVETRAGSVRRRARRLRRRGLLAEIGS